LDDRWSRKKRICEQQFQAIRASQKQTIDSLALSHNEQLLELEHTKQNRIRYIYA
jgi:hypothetical protein